MRIGFWLIAIFAMAMTTRAQVPRTPEDREAYFQRLFERDRRINEVIARAERLKPRRRDAPLRDLNLSDNEVREIQQEIRNLVPIEFMNISPVVSGCSCEEGPECSAQVFVVALQGTGTQGVQLSRVSKAWRVGAIQKWWLEYDALRPQLRGMADGRAQDALWDLVNRFPACNAAPAAQRDAAVS
jgi:hypothetical protein